MMTCEQFDQRLDDLLDGRLDPTDRSAMDAHLAGCEGCRGRMEAMRLVLADAATLPRSIEPPRNLWPDIAARLEGRGAVLPIRPARWRRWAPLAAAAAILIVVTVLVTLRITRAPSSLAESPEPVRPGVADLASDREYELAAGDLERALREVGTNWRPGRWRSWSATWRSSMRRSQRRARPSRRTRPTPTCRRSFGAPTARNSTCWSGPPA